MGRGLLLFQHHRGIVFRIFLLLLFGVGLSGCGLAPEASSPKPVVCTPQAPNVNVYRVTPAPGVATLTPNGAVPNGTTSGVTTVLSQEQALALLQGTLPMGLPAAGLSDSNSILGTLVNETKNWSDVQTIKLDDSSKAQIVVTFISPQLIQAVYYSEVSSRGSVVSSLQSALDAVAVRDELIFFVSIITTTNNSLNTTPHKIQIPIQKMVIMNADDVDAPPLHDDHILAQPIDSSYEPVFGYLSYPIAMIHGTECSWILNPSYNKKIIITVSDIFVDGLSVGAHTWMIPYSSLFKVGASSTSQTIMAIDPNLVSNSQVPPSPMAGLLTPNGLPENTFWQIYAGFLWKQVMQGVY